MRTLIILLLIIANPFWVWGQFNPTNPEEPSLTVPESNFEYEIFLNRVSFTEQSSGASRFKWDFGDGATSTEKSPFHSYEAAGTYTVSLTVSNGNGSSTKDIEIEILTKENSVMGGTVTLNKSSSGFRNFTTLEDLLQTLVSVKQFGADLCVTMYGGQTFELPSTFDFVATFAQIKAKIREANMDYLEIESYGLSTFKLWPTFNKANFDAFVMMSEYIVFTGVRIQFGDVWINVSALDDVIEQEVCPDQISKTVALDQFCPAFTYEWTLTSQPEHITGCQLSGTGNIPAMSLRNESTEIETLVYEINLSYKGIKLDLGEDAMTCEITVYPKIEKTTLSSPTDGQTLSPDNIRFSWESVPGAQYYNLYVWKSGSTDMLFTYRIDDTFYSSRYEVYEFNTSYQWKVVAITPCSSILSDIFTFTLRKIPDLQITELTVEPSSPKPGQDMKIRATIMNVGTEAITASSWKDALYESRNSQSAWVADFDIATRNLDVNESYNVTFTVKVPYPYGETLELNYYLKTDAGSVIEESDEQNNQKDISVPITLVSIPKTEYEALCQLYKSADGANWMLSKRWDITSDKINRYNWEKVTFDEEGHVTAIALPSAHLSGTIPPELFQMPYLKELNLSNNQLSGDLNKTLVEEELSNTLESLDLNNNKLTGFIPAAINELTKLKKLDLSYNRIDSIEAILDKELDLNISYQTVEIDSIQLLAHPIIQIPAICKYDHASQKLDAYPNFDLSMESVRMNLSFKDNEYSINNGGSIEYRIASGQEFTLTQNGGNAHGTHSPLKIFFETGDSNMDQLVDVLDIQHTLNYITKELEAGITVIFNFIAANTYKDEFINVQDIVSTVNILLNEPLQAKTGLRSAASESFLSVEGGYLVLDNRKEPVTAMDISLKGVKSSQIELLLSKSDFIYTARDTKEGVRFILLSMNGTGVSIGKTKIVSISAGSVSIQGAKLSNKNAEEVPVMYAGKSEGEDKPTDTERIEWNGSTDPTRFLIPNDIRGGELYIYNMHGQLVGNKILTDLLPGEYSLRQAMKGNAPGVYIVRLTLETSQRVLTKTIKLIITK